MMTRLFYFGISFLTFLQILRISAQALSTEIYVDSKSSRPNSSNQPNGTITSPYYTLADAWNNLSRNSQLNVTIYLANGVYQLPMMRTNGSMIINIQPQDVSNPSVYISTIDTQVGKLETGFTPNLMVQAQSTFLFKRIHFTSTLQSTPITAFFVDGNSTLSIFDCTLENGPNSIASAFQFSASGNSTMIIQSLKANSVFLEMSASDSGDLSIDSSYFMEAKGSTRGLVVALDNSTATVMNSNFVKITGNIIGLQQLSNLLWQSSDISEVVCDQNQFGIAMIQHDSQLFIRDSVLANVSATQGITCSGGLMGIYNQGQITIENSKLQKMVGRLVYAEGNSTLTISSNTLLENLFEPDQVGQGGAQYLGSIRGNAQVQVMDSILNTLTGSWIVLENGYLAIQRATVIDNFCPSSKSYWVSLAGTAMLVMNGVQFSSSLGIDQQMLSQSKACTIVTASEQALVSFSESWISRYKCRSACLISRGQSLVTLDHTKFTQLYSSDSKMSLISLTDQAQHLISRLNCSDNTGNSLSVIGIIGLDSDPFTIQISNSIFSNNHIPSVAIGQGSTILISQSNFTNNLVPIGGGSPVINQGSLTVLSCTFNDNAGAKLGGAIYHSGYTLTINASNFFRNRASLDGGGLYLSSPANLTSLVFLNNIARRGGGWFSLDSVAELHNMSDISYSYNHPNNFAGTFHALQLGGNSPTNTNRLIARPGSTLNTTIEVRAFDAYGQLYQYGGLDSVILIKAYVESSTNEPKGNDLKLIGETTQALVRGIVLFRSIQVYGPELPQSTNNTLLYRLKVSRQLADGEFDSETSVSVPLTLQGCRSDSMLEPSSAWGPEYLACTLIGCPQGCSNGECVSAGNCDCLPGWEGLACDQKNGDVDSIIWRFNTSAFPYASVGVRNALGSQIQALAENLKHVNKTETKSEYTAQVRQFRKAPEDQSIEIRFIVINTILNEIVQENQLSDINSELLRLAIQPNTPIIRSRTPVFGYTWPPTMGLSNALVSTSIKKVKKLSVSVKDPIGASLIMVHLLGLAGALGLWIFLVVLPRNNSAIVRSSTRLWLSWYTLGTIILHLWMIAGAMPPSDYICQMQFGLSTVGVATMMGANMFKAYHLYLTHENPVLTKLSDEKNSYAVIDSNATSNKESSKNSYTGLGWSASGLVLPSVLFIGLEAIVLLGWLIPSSPLIYAKVTWSASAGSYWQCTLTKQLLAPGAFVFYVVHIIISAGTLYMLHRVKHAVSLSQEPKICLFVTLNVIGSLSIIGSIQSTPGSFGVVVQYMIMSFALGMCLYVSSMGNLGYKVWLIMKAKNKSKLNSSLGVAQSLKKGQTKRLGTNKAGQVDEIDESLCQLQQSNVLASALVPVRILGKRTTGLWNWPTPWEIAFLEIAKEYRYLTVVLDDQPARFFGLPCSVQVDRPSMVIWLKFKSGTLLEIQTRSLVNLDEWETVFQHVNTPINHVHL